MCNPIAIGIMMALSTAMQVKQNNDAAQAQMDQAAIEANLKNEATANQIAENNEAAALDKLNSQRETMRRLSLLNAGAGESGVGGNSVLRQFATTELQGSHDEGIIESTRQNANRAAELGGKTTEAVYNAKIQNAKNKAGSPLANGISIATSGVQGYLGAGGKVS